MLPLLSYCIFVHIIIGFYISTSAVQNKGCHALFFSSCDRCEVKFGPVHLQQAEQEVLERKRRPPPQLLSSVIRPTHAYAVGLQHTYARFTRQHL